MAQNRYSKTLVGRNTTVIVAGQCAITAAATTYAAFVNSAVSGSLPDGTIGVFLEATNLTTTSVLTAGAKFYIAQALSNSKGGWNVKKTPTYTYSAAETSIAQQVYVAPVKPVAYIGFNGTSGSLNLGTITPTYSYLATINDTSPANQPIPSYVYDEVAKTGSDAYSLLVNSSGGLVNKINDYGTGKTSWANLQKNPKIYKAFVTSNGTPTAAAATTNFALVNGSPLLTCTGAIPTGWVVGDSIAIAYDPATDLVAAAAASAANGNVYKIVAVNGLVITLDQPWLGLTTATNTTLNRFAKLASITEYGIKVTTTDFDSTFRLSVSQYLENATITYATDWKVGSGRAIQVKELEDAGTIFQGVTTGNTTFTDNWGKPTSQVGFNRGYKAYNITATKTELSVAKPVSDWTHKSYCIILAAHDGTETLTSPAPGVSAASASPIVQLTTILAAI